MRFHWMAFIILFYLFLYHSKGTKPVRKERKVPIVFHFADEAKRIALMRRQSATHVSRLQQHVGVSLQVVAHGAVRHTGDLTHLNDTSTLEYVPEEEEGEPTEHGRRVKRWGHQHHHHQQHHHQHHQRKPVSLDFECNSDNFHEHLTKQHDASGSSDGTTSAPSSSSSSDSDDDQGLSLFIKRPQRQPRPHHHGPHLTFRCNAHNHHIFKHFRRSSK